MLKYSPYDNIQQDKKYPHIYIETSLVDSEVQYSEPLKYFAKMKQTYNFKYDYKNLVIHIRKEGGHNGSNDRYKQITESMKQYAFILKNNCHHSSFL